MPPRKKARKNEAKNQLYDEHLVSEVVARMPMVLLRIVDEYADPEAMIKVLTALLAKHYNEVCRGFRREITSSDGMSIDTVLCKFVPVRKSHQPQWDEGLLHRLRNYATNPGGLMDESFVAHLYEAEEFTLSFFLYDRETAKAYRWSKLKKPLRLINDERTDEEKEDMEQRTESQDEDELDDDGLIHKRSILSDEYHVLLVPLSVFGAMRRTPLVLQTKQKVLSYMRKHFLAATAKRVATQTWQLL